MYLERRALPKSNKITFNRQVEMSQKMHKDRLKSVKSVLDNKPPKPHKHLRRNLKKEQMMEDRFATIERENRILLAKMSDIMQKNTLDNSNDSVKYAHSLNRDLRQRELRRITDENQAILRRIQRREPVYNHYEWEEERVQNERYLSNIMEYKVGQTGPLGSRSAGHTSRSVRYGSAPTSMYSTGNHHGAVLEPMDEDYERDSHERAARQTSPEFPSADHARGRHLNPLARPPTTDSAPDSRDESRDASKGEEDPQYESAGAQDGQVRFSVGRKLGADYFMVSQSHGGVITLYNPFTTESQALSLDGSPPDSLEEFRATVDRIDRTADGEFYVSDHATA